MHVKRDGYLLRQCTLTVSVYLHAKYLPIYIEETSKYKHKPIGTFSELRSQPQFSLPLYLILNQTFSMLLLQNVC